MTSRYIAIIRHGTKQEMTNRLDLPICPENQEYCQSKKTFTKIAKKIKKSPNKKIIYSSPFLRTRQTAGRLGKKMDYQHCIRVSDGLGESYDSVVKELKKCNEYEYRIPDTNQTDIDSCLLSTLNKKEIQKVKKATEELKKYKFLKDKTLYKSPKNKKEQDCIFRKNVCKIINEHPDKDIVIVTHGRNVRKSPKILTPNMNAINPKTCGSILFKQTGNKFKIVDKDGIFLF